MVAIKGEPHHPRKKAISLYGMSQLTKQHVVVNKIFFKLQSSFFLDHFNHAQRIAFGQIS